MSARDSMPPEVRQLEQLLQTKLIPWVQSGAPLILMEAEPQSSRRLNVRSRKTVALKKPAQKPSYPERRNWPERYLNSTSALVLGCVFEGEADYRVHTPPGEEGREWTVPVEQGSFFVIPPHTPFSDGGKVGWERPGAEKAFARGILIHLRRDGVSCHTFTNQKGKLWLHPYIFLYEFESAWLGEKLLRELRRPQGLNQPMPYIYLQLILRSLARALAAGEHATLHGPLIWDAEHDITPPAAALTSDRLVNFAAEYIRRNLSETALSSQSVSAHCDLSQRHLNRLFQQELRLSVSAYIQQQRDEKACDLLSNGLLPIGTISAYCGFKRVNVFSAWFARRHGISPSQFRTRP